MGLGQSVELKGRELITASKLMDIRQTKRQLEVQQSLTLAATRERLLWIGGYYGTLGALSVARLVALRRAGTAPSWDMRFLPVNQVLVCLPPFLAGYQLDYALFGKSGRLYSEADAIRNDGPHHWFGMSLLPVSDDRDLWFNQPLELPKAMEGTYAKMKKVSDAERAAQGLPPDKDWATFK